MLVKGAAVAKPQAAPLTEVERPVLPLNFCNCNYRLKALAHKGLTVTAPIVTKLVGVTNQNRKAKKQIVCPSRTNEVKDNGTIKQGRG